MKKLLIYASSIFIFWILVLIQILKTSLPYQGNLSYKNKVNMFSLVPEGWGFFTRNPKEPQYIMYAKNGITKLSKSNTDKAFYFGLSRENRLINIELSLIVSKINENSWSDYSDSYFKLDKNVIPDTIRLDFKPKLLSGNYFIVEQQRIPWEWSRSHKKIVMPYKYAHVYVE